MLGSHLLHSVAWVRVYCPTPHPPALVVNKQSFLFRLVRVVNQILLCHPRVGALVNLPYSGPCTSPGSRLGSSSLYFGSIGASPPIVALSIGSCIVIFTLGSPWISPTHPCMLSGTCSQLLFPLTLFPSSSLNVCSSMGTTIIRLWITRNFSSPGSLWWM
jgi:hypothetical protein